MVGAGEPGTAGRGRRGTSGGLDSRLLIVILVAAAVGIALVPIWLRRTRAVETMRTELRHVLAECRARYAAASTAEDTVRVDAWVPPGMQGEPRPGDPPCGRYRRRGMVD
ncbi:MAG TPA: hypothetical protein VNK43_06855 [Gemmatimonadales bacterium]|nr:hypothetical protein [Gemmatimonadales bacterium]